MEGEKVEHRRSVSIQTREITNRERKIEQEKKVRYTDNTLYI